MKKSLQIIKNQMSYGRYSPDVCHENLFGNPSLSFEKSGKAPGYKEKLKETFLKVLGDMPEGFVPTWKEESREDKGNYIQIRYLAETEKDCFCPCYLLLPKNVQKPPVVICLQGHSNGMMISLGEVYRFRDRKKIDGDRDYALQAIEHGYAAMVVEQRGFGERRSRLHRTGNVRCDFLAYNALLVGRTLIGERIYDVSQIITLLETVSEVDFNRIGIVGNSGGGTVSYYAACFDERIKVVMPGCSVCSYRDSIGKVYHCPCNYLPSAAKYFDMGDLACLIYPRPIVVVCGKKDPIFPIEGVQKTFSIMKSVYSQKPENVVLVIGNGKHRFYREGWEPFDNYIRNMQKESK